MSSSSRTSLKPTGGWAKKQAAIEKQRRIEVGLPQMQAVAASMLRVNSRSQIADDVESPLSDTVTIRLANSESEHRKISEDLYDSAIPGVSGDPDIIVPEDGVEKPKPKKLKRRGKYLPEWEVRYPWLTYDEISGTAFCKYCQSSKLQ